VDGFKIGERTSEVDEGVSRFHSLNCAKECRYIHHLHGAFSFRSGR